jgi:hypothetical protein
VYCPASNSKLSIIDPDRNSGIRLATGGFPTSRIESLCVESGEPSLCLRRTLLLCSFAAKMAAQPNHPAYDVVFHVVYSNRYELQDTTPRPVGVRFKNPLQRFIIHLPHVVPVLPSSLQSWPLVRPACDFQLFKHAIGNTSALTFRRLFVKLPRLYNNLHWQVLTPWFDWLSLHLWGPGVLSPP